jgi:tRNA(fMet)-specific endonuclease VapC
MRTTLDRRETSGVIRIEYGLARLSRSRRRRALDDRFGLILQGIRRAVWDDGVSRAFGRTKALLEKRGARVDDFDVAIAAHALALGATLVSENLRHFGRITGLAVESWSEP